MAIAMSLAVLLSGGVAVAPVRDAVTGAAPAEAYLVRPLSYVLLAPVSNVLDTLTLLSVTQHIALFAGALILLLAWRVVRAVRRRVSLRTHLYALLALVIGYVALAAAATLLPRPMAALVADDAHILRVDFHAHTNASHDGHQSVRALRDWHERAGYNVVYITDHATVEGAERGIALNPTPAGTGVTILQGIEVTWNGEHVNILGAERTYRGLLTANKRDVDVQALELASLLGGREPVVIWNHPHQLDRLPIAAEPGAAGVRAIELVNGAPDDRDAIRRNRAAILALAERHDLALTAGSDNHGWGSVAPGWTLLRIFGWRGMNDEQLALAIERVLREGGRGATRVIERRIAEPGTSTVALALSIATVPGRMLTTLSTDERVAWLFWIWALSALGWVVRRRRALAPRVP